MAVPRALQIDLNATHYYHCMTRCVRRTFLCGPDNQTGKDYSHRKEWIVARIKKLATLFAIKICAYAIMSNHYHLVLFVDETLMNNLTDNEIKERWSVLFPRDAEKLGENPASDLLQKKITTWRNRLISVSWFMRCLNELIARLSNQEDGCKGRFWEGRFKSQALLDEGAVLAAMAYVDLNPIRAKIADRPEDSEFTSIYERIKTLNKELKKDPHPSKNSALDQIHLNEVSKKCDSANQPAFLMPFANGIPCNDKRAPKIEFRLSEYLRLIDSTGRILREDKRGAIPKQLAPILQRLNLAPSGWINMVSSLEDNFSYAIGDTMVLTFFGNPLKKRGLKGSNNIHNFYLKVS